MNIYTGLLFQHGHIANPELARSLAGVKPVSAKQERCDEPAARAHAPDKHAADKLFRVPHAAAKST